MPALNRVQLIGYLGKDPESSAIIRAISTLADGIGVPVTVEGIEDAATHAAVAGFGCAMGQGWYFGKPMNGDQASALLRSRKSAGEAVPLTYRNASIQKR